jgi:hypothetical protein
MRKALLSLLLLSVGSPAADPPEVALEVRTIGGQSVFHVGEVIPLELSFTPSVPKAYQLDMASYDRSGRLGVDTFAVLPEAGWDDPLWLYFHSFAGFIGGGLRGYQVLSPQPTVVKEELNEWVRFREPGAYRLTVISRRVSRMGEPRTADMPVPSNELSLKIVPATPDWQRQTFESAVAILQSEPAGKRTPGSRSDRAMKTLRYLGTAEAAQELAQRLDDPVCGSDCMFGLIGSPARDAARDAMYRQLHDPGYGVTSQFVATLSVLALPENASGDIPAQRVRAAEDLRRELISALSTKRGAALAISINTIVEDAAITSKELPAGLKASLTAQLVANFDQLPVDKQMELLQYRWNALDHVAMLPLLKQVAQRYQDFAEPREMHAWNFNNAGAAALQHWYDVDPAGARPAMLREILRPQPRFDARVLGILPDRELPEAEQALAEHLAQSDRLDATGNLASLIHRYATGAVEAVVTGYLDERLGKLACAIQEPLLAYLIKVDPSSARSRVAKAMEAKGAGFSACNRTLLVEVAKLQNDPLLQDAALQALDSSDAQVVQNAAAYLGEFGSVAAEQALWSHFTAWSRKWAGRETAFQYSPDNTTDTVYEAGAGYNLLQALAAGQAWIADEPKLRRLVQLAVGSQQKQQAEGCLKRWQAQPWTIQFIPTEKPHFLVVQYELKSVEAAKDKLAQFPAGAVFKWAGDSRLEGEKQAFEALSGFATAHGMTIRRDDPPR